MAVEGRALVPQRYAIDFLRLHEDGSVIKGDPKDNGSYAGYAVEVLSVADARVAVVKDGILDNAGDSGSRDELTLDSVGGNFVILDLGNHSYAVYAHLQPGSIRVKPGDRVRAGQALGRIGNSGNSAAPHLHFQLSRGPSLLGSEAVPYVFDSFLFQTAQMHKDGFRLSGQRGAKKNELPLQNWVVDFPQATDKAGLKANVAPVPKPAVRPPLPPSRSN